MEAATLERPPPETARTDYSRLRDLIRGDIIEGRLAQGSRLKIAELARRYRTSAIPVREALQQLQGEGIVRFIPNRGASVRIIDEAFIRNIHEVREFAEPFLIRWFVRQHTEEELAALEATQDAYDAALARGDRQSMHDLNRRFHSICYDRHYNEEALGVAKRHSDLIRALSLRFPASRTRGVAVGREHRLIIDAIRQGDEAKAAQVVASHVRNAGTHLIEVMRNAGR